MDRIVSVDERIRRAEELYNRRKLQGGVRVSTSNVNSGRPNWSLLKKMIIKIIVCIIIYTLFYILKNSGMFFSKNIVEQTQKIMSYDTNFYMAYLEIKKVFQKEEPEKTVPIEENNIEEPVVEKNSDEETIENSTIEEDSPIEPENIASTKENQELGIGGGNTETESVVEKSQMEIDAEYVKQKLIFLKPLKGVITSRYGPRTPTEIISAFHQGIDIDGEIGTQFVSAIDGTVTKVSSVGNYGNHIKVTNGDITTIYAHCNKILVTENQQITRGQVIGEVGETGRATGPHLHFEIQREGRPINPDLIINF